MSDEKRPSDPVPGEPPPVPDASPQPEARRHRLRDTALTLAASLLAFAIGLGVFNGLVMPRFIHSKNTVEVPDLRNLTFEQAQGLIEPSGLLISRAGERFDPGVPRGFILAQEPPAGTPVRGQRRVMVTVSLGEEYSSVPELYGESRRGAQLLLERAGLEVGVLTRAPSEEVPEGSVLATDPPAESVLPNAAKVALLVSSGPGVEEYVMPDLVGREIGGVRRQLEALGVRVLLPPSAADIGPIVTQDPPPGARVTRDVVVTLQAAGRVIR